MTTTIEALPLVLDKLDLAWRAIENARQQLLALDGCAEDAEALLVVRDGIDAVVRRLKVQR